MGFDSRLLLVHPLPYQQNHQSSPNDDDDDDDVVVNDGVYDGKRLLPEGYVEYSTGLNSVYLENLKNDPDSMSKKAQSPGRQWWLNRDFNNPTLPLYKNAPKDTFMAVGHWGQLLIVIPSEDLIIVRFGEDRKARIDREKMFGLIFDFLNEEGL